MPLNWGPSVHIQKPKRRLFVSLIAGRTASRAKYLQAGTQHGIINQYSTINGILAFIIILWSASCTLRQFFSKIYCYSIHIGAGAKQLDFFHISQALRHMTMRLYRLTVSCLVTHLWKPHCGTCFLLLACMCLLCPPLVSPFPKFPSVSNASLWCLRPDLQVDSRPDQIVLPICQPSVSTSFNPPY